MKRILAMAISVVLVATMAIGGSIAYLTDTDDAINVMTLGKVDIEQIEQERDENNELIDITNPEEMGPLLPAVSIADGSWTPDEDGYWPESLHGAIDKVVTVENTGTTPAYVRTYFAFEADASMGIEHIEINWNNGADSPWLIEEMGPAVIDGKNYVVFVATLKEALAAESTTAHSLRQVAMASEATNEYVESFGGNYEILVLTQAVQSDNFDTAYEALADADKASYDNSAAKYALSVAFEGELPWENSDSLNIAEVTDINSFYTALRNTDVDIISMAAGEYNFVGQQARLSYLPANQINIGSAPTGAKNVSGSGIYFWRPVTVIGSGSDTVIKVGNGTGSNWAVDAPIDSQAFICVDSDNVTFKNLTINNASTNNTLGNWTNSKPTIKVVDEMDGSHSVANFTLENVVFKGNGKYDIELNNASNAVFNNVSSTSSAYIKLYKKSPSTATKNGETVTGTYVGW